MCEKLAFLMQYAEAVCRKSVFVTHIITALDEVISCVIREGVLKDKLNTYGNR